MRSYGLSVGGISAIYSPETPEISDSGENYPAVLKSLGSRVLFTIYVAEWMLGGLKSPSFEKKPKQIRKGLL